MSRPYFINPDIDALATASPEERPKLVRRIAACVGDEATLRSLLGIDPAEFANFYPDLCPVQLSTSDTIDTFISRFSSEKAAETPEIEEIVTAPAIDYAMMLESEEPESDPTEDSADETSDLISSFLQAVPVKKPSAKPRPVKDQVPEPVYEPVHEPVSQPAAEPVTEAVTEPVMEAVKEESKAPVHAQEPESLSESLFKLMVKNKNYTKALEIITELSLNNPKKSIYFAYQIRFLKKLIKNLENGGQNTPISD